MSYIFKFQLNYMPAMYFKFDYEFYILYYEYIFISFYILYSSNFSITLPLGMIHIWAHSINVPAANNENMVGQGGLELISL